VSKIALKSLLLQGARDSTYASGLDLHALVCLINSHTRGLPSSLTTFSGTALVYPTAPNQLNTVV
jgi:hypothetical protein